MDTNLSAEQRDQLVELAEIRKQIAVLQEREKELDQKLWESVVFGN